MLSIQPMIEVLKTLMMSAQEISTGQACWELCQNHVLTQYGQENELLLIHQYHASLLCCITRTAYCILHAVKLRRSNARFGAVLTLEALS